MLKTKRWLLSALLLALPFLFGTAARAAVYAPGEVLILLKGTESASLSVSEQTKRLASLENRLEAQVFKNYASLSSECGDIFIALRSDAKTTEELLEELSQNPDVRCASPNYVRRASAVPDDPRYGELWGLQRMNAETAWEKSTGSGDIYVAVMDTGIDTLHPDLASNIALDLSRNFTSSPQLSDVFGHGTHVSGTIGAVGNNSIGVAGINWKVKIIALKVLSDGGWGYSSWELEALDYLVGLLRANPSMRIPALNLSLGGWEAASPEESLNTPLWHAYKALDRMNRTVIAVAAGNEAHEVGAPALYRIRDENGETAIAPGDYCYPASYIGLDNMIVAGAIGKNDGASSFTNWSSRSVHLNVPGEEILSTTPNGGYAFMAGTSMATPHVSGAVALLSSVFSDMNASRLKSHLLRTADTTVAPKAPARIRTAAGETVTIRPQKVSDTTLSAYGLLDLASAVNSPAIDIRVESIELPNREIEIAPSASRTLPVFISPENATEKSLSWSTSNAEIVLVDANGTVTGKAQGSAVIAATANDGSGAATSVTVTVGNVSTGTDSSGGGGCSAMPAATALFFLVLIFLFSRSKQCSY